MNRYDMLQCPMQADSSADSAQYRVTLFFGPEPVEAHPSTQACVFNVKKRSWKGGIQVLVEATEAQIDASRTSIHFSQWLTEALGDATGEERAAQEARASELFVQALCRCRLDRLLQAGITQENQRLTADAWNAQEHADLIKRRDFIRAYVAAEMDLQPGDPTPT
ncbi:conserved protein of unknown function [Nitrospira japonica]|uniref:Uncharacterized protein n=2 Tax=Nitrospira japonica TaxID=1325564 RepID=A0A1W1I3A6_9BACT|nr:conserved protein of unknown function [Nitrospira japonica]